MCKKTKRKFLLVEVLVAFAFATITFFFILSLQSAFIRKARFDTEKVACQEKSFEALFQLVENLYERRIPFHTIRDGKTHLLSLDDEWQALYCFSVKEPKEGQPKEVHNMEASIVLLHHGKEIPVLQKPLRFILLTKTVNPKHV
jgi:hypothetical protein